MRQRNCVLAEPDRERESEVDFIQDLLRGVDCVAEVLEATFAFDTRSLGDWEEPVLLGHLARLVKVYDTLVFLVAENRADMAFIMARMLFDTTINMLYLLEFGSAEMYERFVRAGLAYERRAYDQIESFQQGEPTALEVRMRESIRRSADRDGFNIEDIGWDERHWEGSLRDRAERLGRLPAYEVTFRIQSYAVHGTWPDLRGNHLTRESSVWQPNGSYRDSRPQLLDAPSVVVLDVCRHYLAHLGSDELFSRIDEVQNWFIAMRNAHEAFIEANIASI